MTSLEVWDTGMSNGVVRVTYTPDTFPEIDWVSQFDGGLNGVIEFLSEHDDCPNEVVSEKFRPMPRIYKANEWESLRIEGALALHFGDITWQYNDQLLIGGMSDQTFSSARQRAAANKRTADDVLRGLGLWHTGKQVGMKDADDVNSAMKHLIAYLRNNDHKPTLEALHGLR